MTFFLIQIQPSFPPFPQYNGPFQSDRIVTIPVNDSREHYKNLPNKPLIIPQKYAKLLFLYHANPPLWFMSQVTFTNLKLPSIFKVYKIYLETFKTNITMHQQITSRNTL